MFMYTWVSQVQESENTAGKKRENTIMINFRIAKILRQAKWQSWWS